MSHQIAFPNDIYTSPYGELYVIYIRNIKVIHVSDGSLVRTIATGDFIPCFSPQGDLPLYGVPHCSSVILCWDSYERWKISRFQAEYVFRRTEIN